jgi:hypothetical protein
LITQGFSQRRCALFLFLASVWLIAMAATWWLTARTTPFVPKFDDWAVMVPVVSGNEAVSFRWAWGQLNEHRVPVPRLAYYAAFLCSGGDFRSGSFLSVLLLGMVALGAMWMAHRLRGSSSLADAFFPLVLLHWGQGHIFFVGIALNFTIPVACFYVVALLMVYPAEKWTMAQTAITSLCLTVMALCGLIGIVMAAPILLWLSCRGIGQLRAGGMRRPEGWWCLAMAASATIVTAMTFVNYRLPGLPPRCSLPAEMTVWFRLKHLLTLVTMSLGWFGWAFRHPACIGIVVLSLLAVCTLVARAFLRPTERWGTSGLLALFSGVLLVLGSISAGRLFLFGEALWATTRYATVSITLLVLCYLVSFHCFAPRLGAACRGILFLASLVAFAGPLVKGAAYRDGLAAMQSIRSREDTLLRDIVRGRSFYEAASRFFPYENGYRPEEGANWLEMLRCHNQGPFAMSRRRRTHYREPHAAGPISQLLPGGPPRPTLSRRSATSVCCARWGSRRRRPTFALQLRSAVGLLPSKSRFLIHSGDRDNRTVNSRRDRSVGLREYSGRQPIQSYELVFTRRRRNSTWETNRNWCRRARSRAWTNCSGCTTTPDSPDSRKLAGGWANIRSRGRCMAC